MTQFLDHEQNKRQFLNVQTKGAGIDNVMIFIMHALMALIDTHLVGCFNCALCKNCARCLCLFFYIRIVIRSGKSVRMEDRVRVNI